MAPIGRGIGYGMLVISYLNDVYYALILSWTIFYVAAGFNSVLPWSTCTKDYNTHDCFSRDYQEQCKDNNTVFYQKQCRDTGYYCLQHGYTGFENGHCTSDDGTATLIDDVVKYVKPIMWDR